MADLNKELVAVMLWWSIGAIIMSVVSINTFPEQHIATGMYVISSIFCPLSVLCAVNKHEDVRRKGLAFTFLATLMVVIP